MMAAAILELRMEGGEEEAADIDQAESKREKKEIKFQRQEGTWERERASYLRWSHWEWRQ